MAMALGCPGPRHTHNHEYGMPWWDMARELLNDVMTNKTSDMHQIIGRMIHGDFDDENNWQMVEYVFDKLKSEGCGLSMRFYNTLIEALWWLGQKERAARVLNEATKRGLFPELFRRNKLVWSVDVHRMWPGGACTAISVWLNDMEELFHKGKELPQLASIVVVRGQTEKSSVTRDLPVAKAAYSFLKDTVSSSFSFPGWNKGRIVCQRTQLKRTFSSSEPSAEASKGDRLIPLSNSPISLLGTQTSMSDAKRSESATADSERSTRPDPELMASSV